MIYNYPYCQIAKSGSDYEMAIIIHVIIGIGA